MAVAIKQLLHLLFSLLSILRRHRKRYCWSCCYTRCEWRRPRDCSCRICKLGQYYPHSRLYVSSPLSILSVETDKRETQIARLMATPMNARRPVWIRTTPQTTCSQITQSAMPLTGNGTGCSAMNPSITGKSKCLIFV